jgi:TM2 domain-containing membrane protein YozV
MKSRTVAYMLWALGLVGLGGLHRLYVGRKISGWLYLLTVDLMLVGMFLDYKEIGFMVDEANRGLSPRRTSATAPIVVNVVGPQRQVVVQEVVKEVVKIRCQYCGQLTPQGKPKCDECGARI